MACACVAPMVEKEEKEKLIYLHVLMIERGGVGGRNAWYVLSQTSEGAEMSPAFDIPPHYSDGFLLETSCEVVGSSLYVIGGWDEVDDRYTSAIRSLNTHCSKGWETCFSLPFSCARAHTCVYGRWIYVLLGKRENYYVREEPPDPWGYVFNVDSNEAYPLNRPGSTACPEACVALDDGVLVFMPEECAFYHHDPLNRKWDTYHEDKSNPGKYSISYAISNGIIYLYDPDNLILNAYHIKLKKYLPPIQLEDSKWVGKYKIVHLVSVGSGKLCLIWSFSPTDGSVASVYYTKFSVCYCPPEPHVIVEEKKVFKIKFLRANQL